MHISTTRSAEDLPSLSKGSECGYCFFVRARCTISVERCWIVLHKCASQAAQDHHYGQVCRAMDYQYQFEKCRDLDTWYKAWRMERSSARAWIQYMNGLMMACSCCPHGTASLRNKRTNPNLLCLSRLHVACQSPTRLESAAHATRKCCFVVLC